MADNRDGEVKLLDLGLARLRTNDAEQDATATGQALGTTDYVAPEQINDARNVDIRADIYSLGCTLYKLLSGRAPFEGDRYPTAFAKLTAHVSDQPVSLRALAPHVPTAVADLVDQLLAKRPEDRPSSPDPIASTLQKHASAADLTALVRTAMTSEPKPTSMLGRADILPATQGFWKRRVPIAAAAASGVVGLILGWLAGVLITITHPDGSKTEVNVPKTSHTTISKDGDVDVSLAGPSAATDSAAPSEDLPPADDTARFDGVWKAQSAMHRGEDAPFQSVEDVSLVFHQHDFVVMRRSRPSVVGTWAIDSVLRQITLHASAVDTKTTTTNKGIYRFLPDGRLKLCVNAGDTEDFPVTIQSPRAANVSTITFSRVNMPSNPSAAATFMQDPSNQELLYAVEVYQKLKLGLHANPAALAKSYQEAKNAITESKSSNNLKRMAIAFHNYHDTYKVFPSSRGGRILGKPQEGEHPCSWRVAILPFIDQQKLFEKYRFDQPWDSPSNLALLDKMPELYRLPFDADESTVTGYVGFVGENTALGDGEPKSFRDMTDGTSNVLLLVEAKTNIPWTKPEDYSLSETAKLGLLDNEVLRVLMADGAVKSFQPVSEQGIRQAATINDGK